MDHDPGLQIWFKPLSVGDSSDTTTTTTTVTTVFCEYTMNKYIVLVSGNIQN